MKQIVSMFLLTACLTLTPSALRADDHHDRRVEQERRREWNEREERAYRQYLQERRHQYRDWNKLNRKQQEAYWKWRERHTDAYLDQRR